MTTNYTWATSEELKAVFGPRWAICRNTEKNRARYGRCISKQAYRKAEEQILKARP